MEKEGGYQTLQEEALRKQQHLALHITYYHRNYDLYKSKIPLKSQDIIMLSLPEENSDRGKKAQLATETTNTNQTEE